MTRIVQLANFYGPESGGLRTVLHQLGRGYRAAGVERVLIVPGPVDSEDADDAGVRVTVASPVLPGAGGYRVIVRTRHVARTIEALAPDRLEVSDKLTLTWVASLDPTAVLFSHERLDAILASRVPRWFPLARAADAWNRRLVDRFRRVVCTSAFACEEFDRIGADNVTRVPLGVDLDTFRPADRLPGRRVELVCVGRLSKEKRPELAVATLARLVDHGIDAHLTVAGGGPLAEQLGRAASGLPVTFVGHVSERTRVAALLGHADVALAPCPVETFGLSILEALACGTPVVVADRGAAGELIDEGCGRAAPAEPDSFAAAVLEVLSVPDARQAARARAECYPWSVTTDAMLASHSLVGAVR